MFFFIWSLLLEDCFSLLIINQKINAFLNIFDLLLFFLNYFDLLKNFHFIIA